MQSREKLQVYQNMVNNYLRGKKEARGLQRLSNFFPELLVGSSDLERMNRWMAEDEPGHHNAQSARHLTEMQRWISNKKRERRDIQNWNNYVLFQMAHPTLNTLHLHDPAKLRNPKKKRVRDHGSNIPAHKLPMVLIAPSLAPGSKAALAAGKRFNSYKGRRISNVSASERRPNYGSR